MLKVSSEVTGCIAWITGCPKKSRVIVWMTGYIKNINLNHWLFKVYQLEKLIVQIISLNHRMFDSNSLDVKWDVWRTSACSLSLLRDCLFWPAGHEESISFNHCISKEISAWITLRKAGLSAWTVGSVKIISMNHWT